MIEILLPVIISFITTLYITPIFINFLYVVGIVGLDLHKRNKPKLPASGGICVAFGVLAGLLVYLGLKAFFFTSEPNMSLEIMALTSSVLIVAFGGLFDDLNVKSRVVKTKDGKNIKVGIPKWWFKALLTLPAAVPLIVVKAGVSSISLPFIGLVDFGILYPLLIIPLVVVAVSNMVNLVGGFNGVESGMGIVYTMSLGIYALLHNNPISVVFFITAAALLAFLKCNWYPAKILPGDSLTYLLGAIVASGVIIGNIEKAGLILMIPFIVEFFLKLRVKFNATCLGTLRPDGKLDPPYGKKIYSITHIVMNLKRMNEKQVVIALILLELFFAIILFSNVL